ncbi:antibiotic biosynthesis monooxygenase [Halobaculum sp. CBA1158]|uniref:putative quinol monooxygenase n=1 Tax=Halobaculum sp. CBA1158 TaxID=2904243 RepID=UPI001F3B56EE|nr:antibiotic biosynthesis monooxygenase [Halobaculum sp. CBA1158]UIO99144.1 antibiotic biosynthesis monooxygenase [Halobaculum sp. CBA1158]
MGDSELAILARFEAKPDEAETVAQFLRDAREAAEAEEGMTTWYAVRFDETRFGIFDTFPDEAGRQAHLEGEIATELLERADELFVEEPDIDANVDVIAATGD